MTSVSPSSVKGYGGWGFVGDQDICLLYNDFVLLLGKNIYVLLFVLSVRQKDKTWYLASNPSQTTASDLALENGFRALA